MWLRLAFRQCVKIHMRYDLLFKIYTFLHILSPELFGLIFPRIVPFANHSKFFVKARHQAWSTTSFWKFSESRTWIFGTPTSWKEQDSWFWPVSNASKKNFRVFCNNWIRYFLKRLQEHLQNIYSFIRLQALRIKLCRFQNQKKCKTFAIFALVLFLVPLEKQ